MRGRLAAACAAVLVGIAPPGALACVAFASAPSSAAGAYASYRTAGTSAAMVAVEVTVAVVVVSAVAVAVAVLVTPRAWRTPSAPAPSQAPPAA